MPTTRVEEKSRASKYKVKITYDLTTSQVTGYSGGRLPRQSWLRYPNRYGFPNWVELVTTGTPPPDLAITTLTPNTVSAAAGPTTVTVTGTGFTPTSVINISNMPVQTTYVSATSLTTSYDPTAAGTVQFQVRDGLDASNMLPFTVAALAREVTNPEEFTIAALQEYCDAHPDIADEMLSYEQARSSPRVTLVDWLQGFISHRDEGHIP